MSAHHSSAGDSAMLRTALLVVDVQNDFCEGGSLAVTGGSQVAADITAYLSDHADQYEIIVGSLDDHEAGTANDGHIAVPPDEPDFVDVWPAHCISHSHGAQSHPALDRSRVHHFVRKGHGKPAYSAFDGHTEDGRGLAELLHHSDVQAVHIAGLATDYCVRATVLDALSLRFDTTLLVDLIAAVSPDASAAVTDELSAAGCRLTQSGLRDQRAGSDVEAE